MIWVVVGAVCAAIILMRLVTRRGRRQIWWICATAAPAALLAGGSTLLAARTINEGLATPNLAILLFGLWLTVASGCCQIFWHVIRNEVPSERAILGHISLATLVGIIMIGCWWVAPIHSDSYYSIQEAPVTRWIVLVAAMCFAYWATVATNSGLGAWQILRSSPHHPPGQRAALSLYIVAAALAVLDDALYVAALNAQSQQQAYTALLLAAAKLVGLLAILTFGADSFMAFIAPVVITRRQTRCLVKELEPLWARIRELRPSIALVPVGHLSAARRAELRLERMMTEIGDGLRLVKVQPTGSDPIPAVARALTGDCRGGSAATSILPAPASREDEETLFLALARAYAGTANGGQHPETLASASSSTTAAATPTFTRRQKQPLQQEVP